MPKTDDDNNDQTVPVVLVFRTSKPMEIDAKVVEGTPGLAYHAAVGATDPTKWHITHIATGRLLMEGFMDEPEARDAVVALGKSGVDWTSRGVAVDLSKTGPADQGTPEILAAVAAAEAVRDMVGGQVAREKHQGDPAQADVA